MSDETPNEPTNAPVEPPAPVPPTPPVSTATADEPPPPGSTDVAATSAPKGKRVLALAVAAVVVIGAGGAAFAFLQLRGSSDSLMKQVPAGADLVATVYLNPAASQKVNLFRMTDKFPVLGSESDLTQRLNTTLDQVGSSMGLNHNDFQWLGSQAAMVVDFPGASTPNVEVLINVDDVNAAKATLEKARNNPALGGSWTSTAYKGVDVASSSSGTGAYAFVGDTLVISSTPTGVDSIIDTDQGAPSLADSADFKATSDGLPDGRLAFVYVNVQSLLPLLQTVGQAAGVPSGTADLSALQGIRGFGMTVSAEPNGLAVDFNESFDPAKVSDAQKAISGSAHANSLTDYVPANAIGVAQLENVDAIANAAIAQLEKTSPSMTTDLAKAGITGPDGLLSALTGDVTLEVAPGTSGAPVSGALVVGINDPTKFATAVTKLKDQATAVQTCSTSVSAIAPIPTPVPGVAPLTSPGSEISRCKTTPAPQWQTEDYKGTTINFVKDVGGAPGVAYATTDNVGFIGIGPDSIKAAMDAKTGDNIRSSSSFTAAQDAVPSESQFVFVDVQGALAAVGAAGGSSASQSVLILKPITAIATGSESGTDHTHARFMILIP